jgi:hypothetical protein
MADWPIEEVPGDHVLLMRVHRTNIADGKPTAGAFVEHGDGEERGMSTNWSKHASAQQTLNEKPSTWKGGIIEMLVDDVRKIPKQLVVHAPLPLNRAHTNVKGPKKGNFEGTEIRYKFMSIWKWAIDPTTPRP